MDYIIVQAGGKGTRLGYLTKNKPKALVPVQNLPMLFYLFRKYPDKKFIIIADYKKEVMRKYLSEFADVKYQVVDACGTGTCAGVKQAMKLLPENEAFMLVWSDLILPENFILPEEYEGNRQPVNDYIGISQTFSCRWKYEDNQFIEEASTEHGVAGFFLFTDKAKIKNVPENGELVRWMQSENLSFKEVGLAGTREFGLIEEYEKLEPVKCRPFNRIIVEGDRLTKMPIDAQGERLAKYECAWYEKASSKDIAILPKIYDTQPLTMEYVSGCNIYDCNFEYGQKKHILKQLVAALDKLHNSEHVPVDSFSLKEAYFNKTFERLKKIQNLVPFAEEEKIFINGKWCRNVFYFKRELEEKLDKLTDTCQEFAFIHGDSTFSNMLIRENGTPVLIDPRGYFGFQMLFGDVRYDWAKMYYSIVGNYDRFNLKDFTLDIGTSVEEGIQIEIASNGWEDMEEDFFALTETNRNEIKLIHAIIWLSLTTYAWQDYDSICGAFYNGLYYLEDVL